MQGGPRPARRFVVRSAYLKVYLAFNSAEYLAERHHLAGEPFKAVEARILRAVD